MNQGISSAAGADVRSVVGIGEPNSTEPTTLTPHLHVAELLVSGLSRGYDFHSDPNTQDPAIPQTCAPVLSSAVLPTVLWPAKGAGKTERK